MLILVVGPSGAGKDTLMDGARARLAGDPKFVFATRDITRPRDAGGEAHNQVSIEEFEARRAQGTYALHWGAHGLFYGIPIGIEADLAAGRTVIANVSRGVLTQAAARYNTTVLSITAPIETLAARLAARGRESREDIARRLAREMTLPAGLNVATVSNDSTVETGVARVVEIIRKQAVLF